MITRPSDEILKYIKENFSYERGIINGVRNKNIGSVFNEKCIRISVNLGSEKRYLLRSHIVWFLYFNKWPERNIKHIDGDSFNDRIENLCEEVDYGGFTVEKRNNGLWRARNISKRIILSGYASEYAARLGILAWMKENGDA